VIFTYVPLVEAVERLEKAVANGRPVAIRKTYLSQVQDGFTMINEMDDFRPDYTRARLRDQRSDIRL